MANNQIHYHFVDEEAKKEIESQFRTRNTFILCPFVLVDGVDSISQGIYTDDPDRFKSQSLEQVFQGKNPVIAVWKNSTKSVNQTTEGGLSDFTKPAQKVFQVGETYNVLVDINGEAYSQNFTQDVKGNTLLSTDSEVVITMDDLLDREYWYDFFLLPELGDEFYFINDINVYRDKDKQVLSTEITLRKVNDELRNVTTNAATLLLRSSPGENYAWPKVITLEDSTETKNEVQLDEDKLTSKGIKYLQLTCTEPALLGSFYAWGRRIDYDPETDENDNINYSENMNITESRQLVPGYMMPTSADPILGINSPSDKFYWLEQGRMTIGKEYSNWVAVFRQNLLSWFGGNQEKQHKNYGAIKINDMDTAVESAPDIEKTSDNGSSSVLVTQTYWDDWTIKAVSDISATVDNQGYKSYTPYSKDRIKNVDASLANKLTSNIFILGNVVKLPVEYESKVSPSSIGLFVGNIAKLILGKDPKYLTSNNTDREDKLDLPLLGEHSYIDLASKGLLASSVDSEEDARFYLPLQLFSEDRPEVVSGQNVNTFNIKIELTDELYDANNNVINTADLGDDILYDEKYTVKRNYNSFLLDRIVIQAISMGDLKITAFDRTDTALGSMILNSNSKKTGSILDWTTVIKTSAWESDETEYVTPDIPDSSVVGPDQVSLDGISDELIVSYPRENEVYFNDEQEYQIDLYSEFLENLPDYDGDLETMLNSYSLQFNINLYVYENITRTGETENHSPPSASKDSISEVFNINTIGSIDEAVSGDGGFDFNNETVANLAPCYGTPEEHRGWLKPKIQIYDSYIDNGVLKFKVKSNYDENEYSNYAKWKESWEFIESRFIPQYLNSPDVNSVYDSDTEGYYGEVYRNRNDVSYLKYNYTKLSFSISDLILTKITSD